jgi:hypothetical protein
VRACWSDLTASVSADGFEFRLLQPPDNLNAELQGCRGGAAG